MNTISIIIPASTGVVGGLEPTFFLGCTMKELENSVRDTISKMGYKKFVLANADSCPPGVEVDKFKLVSRIVGDKEIYK